MKATKIYTALIAFAILCSVGCTKDDTPEQPTSRFEYNFVLDIVNQANQENSETRASIPGEGDHNENIILKADIFFFDASGTLLVYPMQANLTFTDGQISIGMSKEDAAKLFNRSLMLYIVTNSQLSRNDFMDKSYEQVKLLVQENQETLNPDPYVHQTSFLMDASKSLSGLTAEKPNLGAVTLRRAASKIVVFITKAGITGYTPVKAEVRMRNYLDKTVIGFDSPYYDASGSDYRHTGWRKLSVPGIGEQTATPPFYTYSNDWQNKPSNESYLSLRVTWRKESDGTDQDYYYRIPFSYIPPNGSEKHDYRLYRNYIYRFFVNLSELGGLDPENELELNPSFELRDWTTQNILASLKNYEYLVVAEQQIEIHNMDTKLISYASSKPISIENLTAYYNTYESGTSTIYKNYYPPGHDSIPKFSIDKTNNIITMTSPVPANYVPVYIEFTVKNSANLAQKVNVVQYPRMFITSQKSEKVDIDISWYDNYCKYKKDYWSTYDRTDPNSPRGEGQIGMTNFNMYTVTTLSTATGDDFVIGGDMMQWQDNSEKASWESQQPRIWGTRRDEATNYMISPKFVIASQRGITGYHGYEYSQYRCELYQEGPYKRGTWRMPTLAEMKLISKLQNDPKSAISGLFSPRSYNAVWLTARQDYQGNNVYLYYSVEVAKTTDNVVTTTIKDDSGVVRCVRDVY